MWVHGRAADPARDERYLVERCERCGHGQTRIEVEPEALYESGNYAPGAPRLAALAAPVLASFDRARMRLLRRAVAPGGQVLEVGAGRGRFLARLARAGYRARGVEPAPHRLAEARARGLEVVGDPVESVAVEPASLDAVVAWHVLEHLADPEAALERFAAWLKPGGTLLVGVPNLRSWQAGIGAEHWFHLDLPRHRHHFSAASLRLMLEQAGFEPVRERHLLAEHNPFGMWQTIVNSMTFGDNVLFSLLKRGPRRRGGGARAKLALDLLITALAAVPAALVAVALELVAGIARRGGTVAVLARTDSR